MTDHERVQARLRDFDAVEPKAAQDGLTSFEAGLALAVHDTDQFDTMHDANRVAAAVGAYLDQHHLVELVAERQHGA